MSFSKKDTLVVKGIAILMMVMHHLYRQPSLFKDYEVSFYPLNQSLVVSVSDFFKICVATFVFLSAYGLTYSLKKYNSDTVISGKDYASYINTRLVKVMWGFWFVFIVSQVISIFLNPEKSLSYFKHGMLQGIYQIIIDFCGLANLFDTTSLNNTWWYMTLAIFIVLVVPFIARLTKRYNFLFVALACVFLPRVIDFASSYNLGGTSNCIRWLFTIVLGVVFAQYNVLPRMKAFMITKNRFISKFIKLVLCIGLCILAYKVRTNFQNHISAQTFEISEGVIPVFVIYCIYEFICDIPGLSHILMFFGKHSMNIFLLHSFIRHYWFGEFTYSFNNWLLIFVVLFGLSLAASVVIELIKKLIRYDKLMFVVCNAIDRKFIKE